MLIHGVMRYGKHGTIVVVFPFSEICTVRRFKTNPEQFFFKAEERIFSSFLLFVEFSCVF